MKLTTGIARRLRAAGQAMLGGILVVLLFFSTLAAGSSSLHELLHSDHSSPAHSCLVTLLDQGHTHPVTATVRTLPFDGPVTVGHSAEPALFWVVFVFSIAERGPPCLA